MHFIEHENHLFTLSYCNSWCWWYIGRIATIIITIIVDMLSLLHIRLHQNLFSLRLITSSVHEPEFYPLTNNDNSKQKLPHRTTQIIEGISHFEFFLVGMYLSIILLPVFRLFSFSIQLYFTRTQHTSTSLLIFKWQRIQRKFWLFRFLSLDVNRNNQNLWLLYHFKIYRAMFQYNPYKIFNRLKWWINDYFSLDYVDNLIYFL